MADNLKTTRKQWLRRNEPWLVLLIGGVWCIAAIVSHL